MQQSPGFQATQDYDAIVIGSGAGGLTTALCLARAGQKVLVLEQHDTPGGWCHSFTLEGHRFSPGVHYIGGLEEGGMMRELYEGLGVADDLAFFELNPDGYDHIMVDGAPRFDIPKGKDAFIARLKAQFPAERAGVDRYFGIVCGLEEELARLARATWKELVRFPFAFPTFTRYGVRSLKSVLDKCFRDPQIKAVLAMQAGDHGLPPSRCPMTLHAIVQAHYFDGGFYPIGGGFAIPRAFLRQLKRLGGELRLETRVQKILVEGSGRGRRAIGVRLADGQEIRAARVISNADPGVTYGRLLDAEHVPARLRRRLNRTRWSISGLSLFMAVDIDAEAAGLDSGNYWWSRSTDMEAPYRAALDPRPRALLDDGIDGGFLTVTTLKDPTKYKQHHTMESFAFCSWEAWQRWENTQFGDRPEAYEALKRETTDAMLGALSRIVPDLRERVVWSDLGTPMTNWHYCMGTNGNLYGTEKSMRNLGPLAFKEQSPIAGLHLVGASTTNAHGVAGATIGGVHVARQILGARRSEILSDRGTSVRIYQTDDPSGWPDAMRRKVEQREGAREDTKAGPATGAGARLPAAVNG